MLKGAESFNGFDAWRRVIRMIDDGLPLQLEGLRDEVRTIHLRPIEDLEGAEPRLKLRRCQQIDQGHRREWVHIENETLDGGMKVEALTNFHPLLAGDVLREGGVTLRVLTGLPNFS